MKRIVLTSSFGAVLDMNRDPALPWTYSAKDWNPITYPDAADPNATPQDAYRGSKKFAEQAAWEFIKHRNPSFDLVSLCPSMVFGPLAHPIRSVKELNESNKLLWNVASGVQPLPSARFPFWTDVRDVANVHVQALLLSQAGGKRYLPVSPEPFSYEMASDIIAHEFPTGRDRATKGVQEIKGTVTVDNDSVIEDFDVRYHTFKETVVDFVRQAYSLAN